MASFRSFAVVVVWAASSTGCASQADEFRKCVSAATQQDISRAEASRIAATLPVSGVGGSVEHRDEERGSYYRLSPENQRAIIEQCSSLLPPRETAHAPAPASGNSAPRVSSASVSASSRPGAVVRIPGAPMLYRNHSVDVATFELDATEVTLGAYKACVDAHACSLPFFQETTFRALGRLGYHDNASAHECHWSDGQLDHPINCVDYRQAATFCQWAGKRLPTAVEMTYAALGQSGARFPWGNDVPPRGDARVCSTYDHTCPVWSNPAGQSQFGIFHLTDNVSEWLADPACEDGAYPCEKNVKAHHLIGSGLARVETWSELGTAADDERGPETGFRCARSVP